MAQRRSAGLVQRNNRASTATSVKEVQSLSGDHKIIHTPDQNLDEYDSMDKQTRLTLMEEVLLLGLKDKEVRLFVSRSVQL